MLRKRLLTAAAVAPMAWATSSAQNSRSRVAPRVEQLKVAVNEAYSKFKNDASGKNSDHILYLEQVDSKRFAVALVTTDNKVYTLGDIDYAFSIQSISKVFILALAMQELRPLLVRHRQGRAGGSRYTASRSRCGARLTAEASLNVCKKNYERIFDQGRRNVRHWERTDTGVDGPDAN